MASCIVCWRAGRSRAPPVNSGRLRSRRLSNAAGGRTLMRAAASSIASGSPSKRAQICATAFALARVNANEGFASRARRTNRSTAGYAARSSSGRFTLGSGTPSGAIGSSCSPRRRSARRLVTSNVSRGHEASRSANIGAASTTCSKLSSRINVRLSRKKSLSASSASPADSRASTALTSADAT